MFSSKELISFVFANENDTYYGDDLLKRDLNQYLWEQLHGSYEAVYFLTAEEDKFRIASFGDCCCKEYVPAKKKWKGFGGKATEQSEQGNWIQQQLQGKSNETAAFVCSLEDFCAVLSDSRWDAVLENIAWDKKRTGIFVLTASATAERTTDLLLESPVFVKLRENAVVDLRSGSLRELYSTLKKRKWDNCTFLNCVSWDHVRAVLLHLAMAYPERFESCGELDKMADYLYAYLREPNMAEERLLPGDLPAGYLLYEQLYEQLSKEYVWKKLRNMAECYAGSACRERLRNGGMEIAVLRDHNSYAGRCLKIHLPAWIRKEETAGPRAKEMLKDICCQVSAPKNRKENRRITDEAEKFLNHLEAVQTGDVDSYLRILRALRFCVSQVYMDPAWEKSADVLKIIEAHDRATTLSGVCFIRQRELELSRANGAVGTLNNYVLAQTQTQLENYRKTLQTLDDLVNSRELLLHAPIAVDDLDDLAVALDLHNTLFLLFINVGAFAVYHITTLLLLEQQKAEKLTQDNQILAMSKLQYDNLKHRINEARQAKHDVRHHALLLREYLRNGKLQEVDAYLESYTNSLPDTHSLVYCQHYAANALLNYFAQQAQKANVEMDIFVQLPETIRLQESDVSVIIGNLLENALDACRNIQNGERKITVRGKYSMGAVYYEVSNPFSGVLRKDRTGKYLTTKAHGHGLGLHSVSRIVQIQGGTMELNSDGGVFRVSLLLPEDKPSSAD